MLTGRHALAMHAALLVAAGRMPDILAAAEAGPDLLVLDMAGAGAPETASALQTARSVAPGLAVFARIRALEVGGAEELAAALPACPNGIWLRDTIGLAQAEQLACRLAVAEAELALPAGSLRVVASVESGAGALATHSLARLGRRLAAISYDLETIVRDLGCELRPGADLPEPCRAVRAAILFAAAAAGVPAIDSPAPPGSDLDAFTAELSAARRDGFSAKLALDLDQFAAMRRLESQAPRGRWMENFVSGVATK